MSQPMRLLPVLLLRLALLVAIAASAVLVVDYANAGDPAFCGVMSGCFAVRVSPYSRLFGLVPLPSVGLAAYGTLFGLALMARKRQHFMALAGLAGLGGLFAVYLLFLQKTEIGAFCQWCVAVDTSAIVAAIAASWMAFAASKDEASVLVPSRPPVFVAWIVAAALSIVAPFLWGRYPVEPPLPAAIQAEQGPPGTLTIVGFTDFECPFCRKMHPVLHDIVATSGGRAKLVRKMNPLASHPGAEPAALVYLCTPEAKREDVADKLYTAPVEELTKEGTLKLAASVGVDADALASCIDKKETRERLEEEKKLFEELGGRGLPFTFIGRRVVLGANVDLAISAAERELAGQHISLPVWAMFVLLGAAALAAMVLTLMTPVGEAEESPPKGERKGA